MATNKHAMIRYQALDKCFSNRYRQFYIEDLIAACNEALQDFYLSKEDVKNDEEYYVKRRTIFNDINFMKSTKGWEAPIKPYYVGKRCYYRYEDPDFSINNKNLSDAELDKLDEALVMLNRFKGTEGFDWIDEFVANFEDKLGRKKQSVPVIGYEQNPYLESLSLLSPIFNYIVNKQVVKIEYEHFKKGMMTFIIHPYYFKQFNNRWFLLGVSDQWKESLTNLALDRIRSVEPVNVPYHENTKFDFTEYFEDVIGVSIPRDSQVVPVVLKFDNDRFPYITSKPMHPSQKVIDKDNCVIQIDVIPNRELEAEIMYYGEQVEVISPEELRDTIRKKHQKSLELYCADALHN